MHPPLTILDQTDELIAIEWLRENGFDAYAEHIEVSLELPFYCRNFIRFVPGDSNVGYAGLSSSHSKGMDRCISLTSSSRTWYGSSNTRSRERFYKYSISDTENRFECGLSTQETSTTYYSLSCCYSRILNNVLNVVYQLKKRVQPIILFPVVILGYMMKNHRIVLIGKQSFSTLLVVANSLSLYT